MKKYFYYLAGLFVIAAVAVYLLLTNRSATTPPTSTTPPPSSAPTPTPSPTPAPPTQSAYKDGTYQGSIADAVYGKLQVAATISGGKLTGVQILEEPNTPGHTTQVNQAAVPQLVQEAIASQGANVDTISGATQTSEAFVQSLGVALAAAQNS